ncbi:bifunctional hydroxymethylpyrimidine kinase/phosphomethylpyrimidine kinase, partial [Brevibacterium sp. UMB10442]|nr:bifunctional hydroxymethylpyrimidine kinase/phosphomethylpyrimidine kinase [Brevibacterium sp. UMB10442]
YLFRKEHPPISFSSPTVETHNTHGTGCTLSSAITAFMARGLTLEKAIQRAKEYLTQALKAGAGITIGQGHGAVNHFYNP